MRIHIVIAFYVFLLSTFYNLSRVELAVLFLVIAVVISFEIINTSVERFCNLYTSKYNPHIRIVKDVAAGAVLVSSAFAAVIGFIFFFDLEVLKRIFSFLYTQPLQLALLFISVAVSVMFIFSDKLRKE